MTARPAAGSRWWFDGAVRGLVLGMLYPFAVALVVGMQDSYGAPMIVLFGVLVGSFVGPVAGLVVGVVCSIVERVVGARWSRRAVGLTGIALTATTLTAAMLAAGPLTVWTWVALVGGPAAMGAASLALWPLPER